MQTKIVYTTEAESQVILSEKEDQIEFDFQDVDTAGNNSFARFALRPHELKTAIFAYLNSVPSQEMIDEHVGKPANIMDGRNAIIILMEEIGIKLKREPIDFVRDYGFIKGFDCEDEVADKVVRTLFWFTHSVSGWKHYVELVGFANRFNRMEGLHNFIEHLKTRFGNG